MSQARRERQRERNAAEMKKLMENVDLLWSSPNERAEEVWQLIQHGCAKLGAPLPTAYDLLCFNAEAIGKAAIGVNNPEFLQLAQRLLSWLYTAHYNQPQDVMGPPDKVQPTEGPDEKGGNGAIQHEQGSGGEESPLSSGHARSSENADVAERESEEAGVPDSGSDVRGSEA